MSDTIEKTIRVKEVLDVKDAIQGIDEIQKNLGKLSLGPGLQSDFDKIFQKIERNAEKANKAMASGFKNKGDVKAYDDAMRQISNLYGEIITKVKVLNNSKQINLQVNDNEVKNLNNEIENLKNNLKELRSKASQAGKDLRSALKEGAKHNKGGAPSWNDAVKAFEDGKIDETEKAIKNLERAIKGAQTRAKGSPLSEDWQKKAADVNAIREAINKYKSAQKDVADEDSNLAAKKKELNDIMGKGATLLTETADIGERGAQAFRDYAKESTSAAQSTQNLNSELEQFKNKAAYFFGLSNAVNLFKRALRSAYDTVKDLDKVMTETAVVTNFDVGDMWSQLPEYTQRANELGVSIHSAYEAATIFYQQGLKTNEVMAVSNETLKMARIAGLDAATASDRMTNALRGFNMEMDKVSAQRVNDVYSKLAAITASNTDEISTAMTKVASLAHNANMEFETTSAFLAQMIETTRESAETAGTALKTVVARFSEVKKLYSKGELLGQDEEGGEIDVNKVSTALRSAGINLNEYLTGAKGLDDIFIELASKWDSLDKVQQRYIATMAAGSRQQSRFIAMMSDYGRTVELVDAANNANGASQEQYSKTLDSLETKLARLKNAWDEFILGLSNSDAIKGAVDLLTNLLTAINKVISTLSGKNAGRKMIISFFAAFSTFKLGSALVGKNNTIAKIFSSLVEASKAKVELSAKTIAGIFENGLKNSLKNGFKNKLDNSALLNYFAPQKVVGTRLKINDKEQFKNSLFGAKEMPFMDDKPELAKSLNEAIDTGNIEKVNKLLDEQKIKLQINKENAEQFGVVTEDVTKRSVDGWKAASAAATAAGAALMAAGDWIKGFGEEFETLGTVVKALGAGLLVFGTIMSVTLPLMAKVGAEGISTAIYSIPIIGWITAIISAIIALGVAIYSFAKNDSFENKLQKANESAKKAADAADEATKAYERLGESWDALQDKYSAIDKATAGTQKWKDAIKEANDEAMKLVATYEGLDTKIGEDGRLIVSEESKDAVQKKLRDAKDMAQAASLGAQLNTNRVKRDNAEFNFRNYHDITGMRAETPEWTGRNGEVYTDEKVTEKLIESYKKGEIKSLEDLRMKATDYYSESALKDPWAYTSKITEKDFKALQNYVNTPSFTDASKSQFNGMVSNALTKMIDKDAVKLGKNLIGADFAEKIYGKEIDKLEKEKKEDKREEYAKNLGYKDYETWKVEANEGKDIDNKELNNQLAAQRAQKGLNNFATQFESNMAQLTQEQLKFFQEEVGGALTKEEIDNLKGQGKNIYESLGGKDFFDKIGISEEEFINQFNTTLEQAGKNAEIEVEGLGEGLVDSLTAGARKSLSENLESIEIASGKEGRNKITKQISDLAENMEKEERDAFIKTLTQVDWSSANSVRTLSDLAKAYGVSEEAIDDLEEQIIKLNNAATKVDLTKVTEQLKSLLGLGYKVSTGTQGRSFSKEDYENLTTNGGMDANDFSYNIATGSYEYIGDRIQDVVDAINNQTDKMFDSKQLEKDVASGEVAQELQNRGTLETDKDKMLFVRDYILGAGENSKISADWFKTATEESKNGNNTIMNRLVEIVQKEAANLGDNKEKLNNYNFEKDVMAAQMRSGAENAARANEGNEAALKALKTQLSASSLSEEIKSKILAGINSGDSEAVNKAGSLVDTSNRAAALGIKQEDLEGYADSLQHVEGLQDLEIDKLYELSLAELNYQKGQQALYDSYDNWSKLIQKNGGIVPDGSIEQGKVFAQLNKDLTQMLNLTEDLPKDFLSAEGRADDLKKAIKGDKNAITQLRAEAAKVQFQALDLDIEDKDKENIVKQIDLLASEMPDLKIGTTLEDTKFGSALMDMVNKAGMSVDQIQNLFNGLGWAPKIEWKKATIEDVKKTAQNGVIKQPDPNNPGKTIDVKLDGFDEWATTNDIFIPQINGKSSYVAPKPPKTSTPKTKKKGKSGGGKKSAKKERWENPYDELYNLQEKINEALRKREALERRYQKLLKQEQSTLKEVRAAYTDQIKHLQTEASLQKQLAAGRLNQINKLGKDTYVTSKGKVKTFEQMGVTKYAKYNKETGEIQIDWAGINKLEGTKHVETGKAVEAYISKLEELVKGYEDTRDALWDIEDKVEDLRQQVIETYLSFEDRVLDALVTQYQRQIDSYQAMSDAIDKVNDEVLKSLREQIDLSRQIRDNTKKEEDISKKENRLAYLRRDTSGANDLEILSLEKELKEAREDYGDNLVDQTIDKLQKDADQASEQRQRQIEIMQTQLDIMQKNGTLWNEAHKFYTDAVEKLKLIEDNEEFKTQFTLTDLAKLLAKSEDTQGLSNAGYVNWLRSVLEEFKGAVQGKDELEDKYNIDVDNDGRIDTTNTQKIIDEIVNGGTTTGSSVTTNFEDSGKRNHGIAVGAKLGGYGWSSNTTQLEKQLKDKGFNENDIREILEIFKVVNKTNWKKMWPNLKLSDYSIDKFARGGLADYTGPAWLDGTKTNPELVLNAQDTRNFIALKDILSSLMNTQGASTKTSSGDNYFDINITADIGSDYDVDKLANRIKKQIFEDSQYRNVNTINYLR